MAVDIGGAVTGNTDERPVATLLTSTWPSATPMCFVSFTGCRSGRRGPAPGRTRAHRITSSTTSIRYWAGFGQCRSPSRSRARRRSCWTQRTGRGRCSSATPLSDTGQRLAGVAANVRGLGVRDIPRSILPRPEQVFQRCLWWAWVAVPGRSPQPNSRTLGRRRVGIHGRTGGTVAQASFRIQPDDVVGATAQNSDWPTGDRYSRTRSCRAECGCGGCT